MSGPALTRLTRQRAFEASHRYWVPTWSAEENARRFGRTCGPFGHGHNYQVWASVDGPVESRQGMALNLTELDAALASATDRLDHRFLNEECGALLRGRQPSTETLAGVLWDLLEPLLDRGPRARLAAVRLAENPRLWAELAREEGPVIRLTRRYSFSAAHCLRRADLDDAENQRVYGKCANPHGHGHDYRLDVTVRGEPDPLTGMVVDLVELDAAVQEAILDPWDHRNLNREVAPFDSLIPTSENVVRVAWERLAPRLGPERLFQLTLWETPRGSFAYWGPDGSAPA